MSQINYKISLPLSAQMDMSSSIKAEILPLVAQAIDGIARTAASRWIQGIQSAKMWSGEKDNYAKTITIVKTGDFSRMVESDYKYAQEIETGRPPRDLKKMLLTSKKIRYVENGKNAGKRYLIIPMRHNTPGSDATAPSMPGGVYKQAKTLSLSTITGSQMQRNGGTGARIRSIKRNTYNWGSSLAAGALKASGASAMEQKRYAGMKRFDTSTPGGGKSRSYLTFRIMGEWSSGWITKAQPGQFIVREVANELQPEAEAYIAQAMSMLK